MTTTQEIYHAKIMLFGEYSVICDSMGLTIPYAHFTGKLSFISDEQYTELDFALDSNKQLRGYLDHMKSLLKEGKLIFKIDLEKMEEDIAGGLYFESTIPQGYGIGSSGALVAAIYDQYAQGPVKKKKVFTQADITRLKAILSQMESYFHGVSSGIDPLLCFINHPLLIRNRVEIETVGIPREMFGDKGAVFLIDTGKVGKTGPLVNLFFEKCNDESFMQMVQESLIPSNDGCIRNLLDGHVDPFFSDLGDLSAFQFGHFREMIPEGFLETWETGLAREDFKLKLCGSGGGGFLLGITRDYPGTKAFLEEKGTGLILVYKRS